MTFFTSNQTKMFFHVVKLLCIAYQTHHAEGLVYPKVRAQKKVTDFGYPRACRFRKYQIENRSPELTRPPFCKT
jgi:hypothetical protein